MAVKMRKWSPWPPAGTRKFRVAVKVLRLDIGSSQNDVVRVGDDDFVAIKIKWKGEPKMKLFPSRVKKELSSQKLVRNIIEWDDDDHEEIWFENTCCFSVVSNNNNNNNNDDDPKFGAWEIAFNVIYSEKMDAKAKTAVIGKISMNLSDLATKTEKSSIEQKLPLSLQIDGNTREATLTVLFNFVEIRDSHQDSVAVVTRGGTLKVNECKESVKSRRRSLSQEEVSLDESDDLTASDAKDGAQISLLTNSKPGNVVASEKKEGWFSWKSRRFMSFKRAKTKEDKCDEKAESCSNESKIGADPQSTMPALETDDLKSVNQDNPTGSWEEKELISRDGQVKLKASVFLASFDQRSNKAAGESACTGLVAVISHWLHSNVKSMPDWLEFDSLIMEGSSEWRKLCENVAYVNDFPNKHFDLETVLSAGIRPISISHNKSYVGFFGAEIFESLKGVMSFDDIWNEISSNISGDDDDNDDNVPRVYIISWNDHFFVLKVESNAYYIIDTLGERLFEGCNQAYILRFDENAAMQKHAADKEKEEEEMICRGKECCREFIKRFLAAIQLKELEEEEKKKTVSYFSLHQRLQIEFNYSCLSSSPSSSLTSSPFSSLTTSMSSPLSE